MIAAALADRLAIFGNPRPGAAMHRTPSAARRQAPLRIHTLRKQGRDQGQAEQRKQQDGQDFAQCFD